MESLNKKPRAEKTAQKEKVSAVASWAKSLSLASMLAFSTISKAVEDTFQNETAESKTKIIEVAESTEPESIESATQDPKIEALLGKELIEEYERNGFKIESQLEAGENGFYIIHVGQTHTHPMDGLGKMLTNADVLKFQKTLLHLIEKTSHISGNKIFTEGVVRDMSESKKQIIEMAKQLEEFSVAEITIKNAEDVYETLQLYRHNQNNPMVRNCVDIELVDNLFSRLRDLLNNYESIYADENEYEDDEESEEDVEEKIDRVTAEGLKTKLSTLSLRNFKNSADGNSADFDSAIIKLYMQDRLEILPTESEDVNAESMNILSSRHQAAKNLMNRAAQMIEDGIDKNVRDELLKQTEEYAELERIKAKFQEVAMEKREAIVLEKIMEYKKQHPEMRDVLLVFGSAHDFSNEVTAENAKIDNPAQNIGLIKIHQPK